MTIEELKQLRGYVEDNIRHRVVNNGVVTEEISINGRQLITLIDAEIARQSVTDEDVGEVIEQVKWYIDFEKSEWANCDELSACEPGAEQMYKDRLKNCETILIVLQQMDKEPQWISVKDRLPTFEDAIGNRVLILWSNGIIDTWNPILIKENLASSDRTPVTVTHWMPLPQPPKESR